MTTAPVRWLFSAVLLAGSLGAVAHAADEKLKFEVYKDKGGEFRWRLKAANGEPLATAGESYKAKTDAQNSIDLVKKSGTDTKLKYEFFEDDKKEHRWRLKAANNQVIAVASEGYKAKADAEKAVASIKANAAKAEVVDAKE